MSVEPAPWLWLCVLSQLPPKVEVRAFWKGQLDKVGRRVADADQFWLGESDPTKAEPPTRAADRVATLLSQQREVTPEYSLPVLTRDMIALILNTYAPTGTVDFPCFPPDELSRFLSAHEDGFAFVRVGTGATTTPPLDEEMDRLMRQHAASVNRAAR